MYSMLSTTAIKGCNGRVHVATMALIALCFKPNLGCKCSVLSGCKLRHDRKSAVHFSVIFRVCVAKGVVGCTMNSEARAAWNLSFYYVNYHYSTVIALGKSNPILLPFRYHWAQYFFATWKCFVTCFRDIFATALL